VSEHRLGRGKRIEGLALAKPVNSSFAARRGLHGQSCLLNPAPHSRLCCCRVGEPPLAFFLTPLVMPSVCFLRCSPCITLLPPLHCSTGGAGERVRCDAMEEAQSSMSRGEGIGGLGERGRLKSPQRAHARVPDAGRTGRGGRCAFSRLRELSLRSPESLSSLPSLQRGGGRVCACKGPFTRGWSAHPFGLQPGEPRPPLR
jgi:hypothetical protein